MKSLLRRLLARQSPRPHAAEPPPIRAHLFPRRYPELFHRPTSATRADGSGMISQLCRYGTLDSRPFRDWIARLHDTWDAHRKKWELAYICQTLQERGLLAPGTRGLGFAVGAEKLPSLLAAHGCRITATDLPAEDERNRAWAATGQWVGNLEALNAHGLCPKDEFRERVGYRPVDMNHIPDDLRGYDFTWSTCSFEHCGSIDLGLRFLERQMACLRPGGDELVVKPGYRLDVHARPSPVVEVLRDRVDLGIVRPDVDVPAVLDGVEHPVEDDVLEILRVRDHAAFRMMRPIEVEA